MDKQDKVEPHNGVLLRREKEWGLDMCCGTDEPGTPCAREGRCERLCGIPFLGNVSMGQSIDGTSRFVVSKG